MDDLISRADAIDAIEGESYDYVTVSHMKRIIKQLPSAQERKTGWIPCSEKMPKGQELVIVSCHDTSGDTSFDYTSSAWTTTDGEYWIVDNEINPHVIAWMPLPEPYKDGGGA